MENLLCDNSIFPNVKKMSEKKEPKGTRGKRSRSHDGNDGDGRPRPTTPPPSRSRLCGACVANAKEVAANILVISTLQRDLAAKDAIIRAKDIELAVKDAIIHRIWALHRDVPPAPTTHSVALAITRDATVAFGAGYDALMVPIQRRMAQYLRQERLFVGGGCYDGGLDSAGVFRSLSYSLDAVTSVWVEEAITEGRYGFGLCVFRGELWAVGGRDSYLGSGRSLRSCERFDLATNTWVRGPDMVTERAFLALGVLNGELWAIGGTDTHHCNMSSCERLDASTGTWIPGPEMGMYRVIGNTGVVVLHGELWVVATELGIPQFTERLDAATNRWVHVPHKDLTRSYFAVAVFRGQLWAVGGVSELGSSTTECEYLDVASNTWMAGPPMNTPRHSHSLAVLDGELWATLRLGGGSTLCFLIRSATTCKAWVPNEGYHSADKLTNHLFS